MSDNTQLYTLLKKFLNFNGAIPAENQTFLFKWLLQKKDWGTVLNWHQKRIRDSGS